MRGKVDKSKYDEGSYREWVNYEEGEYIRLTEAVFDEQGSLLIYTEDNWQPDWLELRQIHLTE